MVSGGVLVYSQGGSESAVHISDYDDFKLGYDGLAIIFSQGVASIDSIKVTADNYSKFGLNSFSVHSKTELPYLNKSYNYVFS